MDHEMSFDEVDNVKMSNVSFHLRRLVVEPRDFKTRWFFISDKEQSNSQPIGQFYIVE